MDATVVKNARARQPLKGAAAVRKALRERGKGTGNISFVYGEKVRKQLVPTSDLELANFLDLESDPQVLRYDLDPDRIYAQVDRRLCSTKPDAVVYYRDFTREVREVKYVGEVGTDARAVAQQQVLEARRRDAGIKWRHFTEADAMAKRICLLNWLDVSAVLQEARNQPTEELENRVTATVFSEPKCTLAKLHDAINLEWRLVFVALFRAHQKARVEVDLSRKLSWNTSITPCEAP